MYLDTRHIFEFTVYSWAILIALFAVGYILYLISRRFLKKRRHRSLFAICFVFLYSILISFGVYFYEASHEKESMRSLADEILNQRDTTLENSVKSLKDNISYSDEKTLLSYLDNTYQYYFTSCKKGEHLSFKGRTQTEDCNEYFAQKIKDKGIETGIDGLYVMRGDMLHYSYLLHLNQDTVNIYLEMGKERNIYLPPEYSYAFFGGDDIWFHRGDFLYSYNGKYTLSDTTLFRTNKGYFHYIVRAGSTLQQALVVTVPAPQWYFIIYNFSFYFILFLFLFFCCNLFSIKKTYRKSSYAKRLRNTISIVVATVFFVFGSIAFFFLQEWKSKEVEADLKERMMTVLMNMETKYMNVSLQMLADTNSADTIKNKWSEDINAYSLLTSSTIQLYGPDGSLILSSLPVPAMEFLTAEAYQALYANQRHLVFAADKQSISAYAPFRNIYNEIFGYLQMSLQTDEKAWNIEMGDFISMYLTLILFLGVLTYLVTYILTKYLTEPLRKISKHLEQTRLSNVVSKFQLDRGKFEDEIGELVTQYNTLIGELEKRDKMLRESAFSEMAHQVAHEIKNPLTPIKLKIQQLLRAYEDKKSDFEERLKNFAAVSIDQIELLTNIANRFSQFSSWQKPQIFWQKPQMKKDDVYVEVEKVVALFSGKGKITYRADGSTIAYFDKEFLGQILTNIIKNAVQAIDEKQDGEIIISIKDEKIDGIDYCCIAIADNGIGISDEDIENIFEWHFTTKTSGSGMGLPISKRLAESMGGFIKVESELGKGSTVSVFLSKSAAFVD
ncbi:MAG: HAMP domain-containing histidine kinase [Bacteroidales bacterium]|jgi:signal transduction histidine kinase|nr:HAMP domain-containing histidine kinase [Bacteroidales bacterium]